MGNILIKLLEAMTRDIFVNETVECLTLVFSREPPPPHTINEYLKLRNGIITRLVNTWNSDGLNLLVDIQMSSFERQLQMKTFGAFQDVPLKYMLV